jgi:gliding motility-associated-like protein
MVRIITTLVVVLLYTLSGIAQTASFTTSPAANTNGTIVICQGQSITYTNTSTGTNGNTNFNWNFQGGSPNNANQAGPHTVTYNNSGNFNSSLNIGGGNITNVSVQVISTNGITPQLTLAAGLGAQYSSAVINGVTVFRKCGGNNIGNFNFNDPNLLNYPAGTTFSYSWGDGTNSTGNPSGIVHTYTGQGYYNLAYTVQFPGGCSFTTNYQVYVGANPPTITLSGSGSGSCLPNPFSFQLGSPTTPPAGTSYQIIYNDGSPPETVSNLSPNPMTINHLFTQTSCGVNSVIQSTTYTNSFAIQVVASNACNPLGTFAAIGPITVAESVDADMSATPNITTICVNAPITFNDISDPGSNVYNNTCDQLYGRYWTITPNSGFTATGALGNNNGFLPNSTFGYDWAAWTNGPQALPVTWSTPGTYEVKLVVGNDCGVDSITYTICVVAQTTAAFTLPLNEACSPVQITPTNTSSIPGCNNGNVFNWSVISSNPLNCNSQNGPSVNPGNSTNTEPTFNFTGPGVYTIQLITALGTPVTGGSCSADTITQTITIKAPPTVSISPPAAICAGSSFTPVGTVNSCYATQPVTYAWDFDPNDNIPAASLPTPLNSVNLNPGAITYPSSNGSPFPFSLTATNECGSTTANQQITVQAPAIVTTGSYGPFCVNTTVQLNGQVSGGATNGYWTSNVAGGSFSIPGAVANSGALNSIYTPPSNYIGNIILTLTSASPLAPCPIVSAQTTIAYNALATVNAGTYSTCMDQPVTVNGTIGGAASSATWTSTVGSFANPNLLTTTWTPPSGYSGPPVQLTLTSDDPAGPCVAATSVGQVTVKPLPVATVPASIAPICSGGNAVFTLSSSLPNTSYTWSILSFPNGIVTTASGTLNIAANGQLSTAITNNSSSPQTLTFQFIPTSNGCPGLPVTSTVTIQPVAVLNPISNTLVCPGDNIAPAAFSSTPVGSTFSWTNSNTTIGLAANGTGNISSYTAPANATNATISGNITVSPTFNGCPGTPLTFTIGIKPTPVLTNSSLSQSICSGANTTAVTWTSNLAGSTFNWTSTASSVSVTGFTASGSGNLPVMTIANGTNAPQTVTYAVVPVNNSCQGVPVNYIVTINPIPVLTLSPNQTICGGTSTVLTTFSNTVSGGSFSYSLQNAGTVPASVSGHPVSGNGQIPGTVINNGGTNPFTLNYTVTPTANGCNGTPSTFSITVNPAPVTTFSQGNQVVCTGSNSSAVTLSSSTANVTFSWSAQNPLPASIGNFTPVSGTGTIPSFTNLLNSSNALVSVSITAFATTSGASQCPGSPATYTITVNPSPVGQALFTTNDTVCNNQNIGIQLSSTTPNTTFTWSATNGPGVTGGANSAAPSTTISQTLLNNSNQLGFVTYTITPSSNSCPGPTLSVQAFVNPVATVSGLSNLSVCSEGNVSIPSFTANPSGSIIGWTNSQSLFSIGLTGTGSIPSWQAPLNNGASALVGNFTVTPSFNNCPGTPGTFSLSVQPAPLVTNTVLSQSICSGQNTVPVAWSSGVTGSTFVWSAQSSSNNVTGFPLNGTGNLPVLSGISNIGNSVETVTFTVNATANSCPGPSVPYVLTLNPVPTAILSPNQTICSGVASLATLFQQSVSGGTLSWQLNPTVIIPPTVSGFTSSGTGQIPAMNLVNSGVNPFNLQYIVTPTANGCSGTPLTYTITVNPLPTVQFSQANQTICSGSNTSEIILTSTTTGVSFAWQTTVPPGISNLLTNSGTGNIPAFTNLVNTTINPITITFSVTASTSGSAVCPGPVATYSIVVNPTPVATFAFISNDTVCSGNQINISLSANTANTLFTWTAVNGAGVTGAANSVSAQPSIQQVLVNSSSLVGNAIYTVTPVISGACSGQPISITAFVNPVAVVNPITSLSFCPGETVSVPGFSSSPNGAVFNWTNSNVAIGLLSAGSGNIASYTAPANVTNSNISGVIQVTPLFNGCSGTPSSFTINIKPTPSILNQPLIQTICSGNPTSQVQWNTGITGSTFAWNAVSSSVNLSGYMVSGNGILPIMNGVLNSGNTTELITYTVTPNANGCQGNAVQYVVQVHPTPVLTMSSNQLLCGGLSTNVSAFVNSVNGGTFNWAVSNPGGIPGTITGFPNNGSGQIPSFTPVNTGTSSFQIDYTVIPVANGCSGVSGTYSITVLPSPTVTFSLPSQAICNGENTQLVTLSSATPNVAFTWSTPTPIPAGLGNLTSTSGNTNSIPAFTNLTNSTSSPISITFTAQASTLGGTVCQGQPSNYTITVNPSAQGQFSFSSNDTICSGGAISLNLSSSTPNAQFSWTTVATANVSGASNSSAPGVNINQTLTNSGSTIGSVTYSITPVFGTCPGTPIQAIAFVNPLATMTPLSSISACPNNALNPSPFVGNPANSTFTWQNSSANTGIGLSGNGQLSPWTAPANTSTSAITSTVSVTPSFNGCPGTSSSFNVTIHPTPQINTSPLNQTVCEGQNSVSTTFGSTLANSSINWTLLSSGTSLTGMSTPSGNNPLPSMVINHSGNSQESLVYNIQATSSNNCPSVLTPYTIFVNPLPILSGVQDQTICSGSPSATTNYQNNVTGGGFNWSLLNTGIPATVTNYVSATGSGQIPSVVINNSGSLPYTLNYLVTPTAANCPGIPDTFSITVMPSPSVQFGGLNTQTLCSGQSTSLVALNSPTPNVTWNWTVNAPATVSGALPTSGQTASLPSFTLSHSQNTAQLVTISITASTTNNNCAGTPATYSIVVNPIPIASATVQGSGSICSNASIAIDLSSTVNNTTYSWTSTASQGVSGNTNSSGTGIVNTLINTSNTVGSVAYTITPSVAGCQGSPVNASVTVNPVAVMTNLSNISACPGSQLVPSIFVSNPNGATFSWANSNPSIGLIASGNGDISPWNAPVNATGANITGQLTVTPTFNGCPGTASSFLVTVFPTPVVSNSPLNQVVCENIPTSPVVFTSNLAGSQLNWAFLNAGVSLSGMNTATGTGTLPSMTVGHSGNTLENIIYTVQATSPNGCLSPVVQYSVNINPNPTLSNVQDQVICSNGNTVATNFANSVQGGGFNWSLLNTGIPAGISGFLSVSSSGQIPQMTITNNGTSAYTLNYLITPTATGCFGIPDTFSITIMPAAGVQFTGGNSQSICSGSSSTAVTMSSLTQNVTWSWTVNAPAGVLGAVPASGTSATLPSFNLSQNGTTPLDVSILVNATTTAGGCPGGQATYTITVNPIPVATPSFASNDSICSNSAVTINLSSSVTNTNFTWTSIAAAGINGNTNASGNVITNTLTNTTGLSGTVVYTITPNASNCPGAPITATVVVNPVAVMTGLTNISACPGNQLSPAIFQSSPAGSTFSWTNSNPAIGINASGNNNIAPWNAPVNQNITNITGTISVTPSFNGCSGTPSAFTVTVFPTPQITTAPLTQTLCESVASAAVIFTTNVAATVNWDFGTAGADISGFSSGNGANPLPSMTFQNNGSTQQSASYTIQASSPNGCLSLPLTYTFNVNPTPVINPPGASTICSGNATPQVIFGADVVGTTYSWNVVNPPIGLSGFTSNGGGILAPMTLTNTTSNELQLVYAVTPSVAGCVGASGNYTITVNPTPTVNFSLSNQNLCSGSNSQPVTLSTSTSNATISWSAAVPSGIGGFTSTSGSNNIPSFNLTNSAATNLTATLTALATTTGATSCPGTSSTYTISVSPQVVFDTIVNDYSLCSSNIAQVQLTSGLTGITYTSVANASAGISGSSNVNGALINQTLTNSSNVQGTVSYTITGIAPIGNVCPNQSVVAQFTVEPVPSVQYSLGNQVICSGTSIQSVALSSNVASATIAWNATIPNGLNGIQASGTTAIPSMNVSNTGNNPLLSTITAVASINGCTGPSAPYTITVHPNPGLTINPSSATICSGTSIVSNLSSNVANTVFNWTFNPNPNITGASNGSGPLINQTLTNPTSQTETITYNVTTLGPGPGSGCPGQSGNLTVTVNPVPTVAFNQLNQTICSGTSSAAVLLSSATANAQISWVATIPAGISGATASGTSSIPVQTLINTTNGPLTVVYNASVVTNTGNCSGQSTSYSITVNPPPVLSFSTGNQVLCSGVSSTAVTLQSNLAPTAPGTINYNWTAVQPNGISGVALSGTGTIPIQTLVNSSNSPVTITYTGQISYTNNNTTCAGTGGNYTITVNPLPAVTAAITDPIICSGETAEICFSSPVTGASYNYTVLTSNGITGASNGTVNCLNQTLVNGLLAQGSATYTVTASANNCSGTPATAVVLINPLPVVSPISPVVVCPGTAIGGINFTSTPAGGTFNWTNSEPSVGLSASGIGPISGWVAPANGTGGAFNGTISVNATLNGCTGPNTTFGITINPTPSLTVNPQVLTICSGTSASISCSSNVPNASFGWTVASTNVNGASNGNGGSGSFIINQNLTATGNAVGNVTYTITPQANNCSGLPVQVPVTVNPIPNVVINPNSQTICSGEQTSLNLSSNLPGTTFGWTISNNAAISGAFDGSGSDIQQTLSNGSVLPQPLTYTVTPSLNGCNGSPVNATVTVNPIPVVTPTPATQTICSGQSTSIVLNSNVSNTTYAYTFTSAAGITGPSNGSSSPIIQQLTNTTPQTGAVTYEITPTSGSCIGSPVTVVVNVNPVASVIPSATQLTFCSGQNAIAQLSSNVAGASFSWTVTSNPQLSGQAGGNGNTINQQVTNNTFIVQNYNYVITPSFGNCPGTQYSLPVTVNPLPQIFPGALVNTCISTPPFVLSGYSPTGGTWQGTGISNSVTGEFSPSTAGVGQFNLVYTYTNPLTGCTNTATKVVQVNPLPTPQFTMDTLRCTNTTVNIVNNSLGGGTYFWEFGNGATSNAQNPIYQYPQGGQYTVQLTVTSPQGCVDSVFNSINIITSPNTSFIPTSNLGCGPLPVNFANTTTGSYITSYFWNFGYPTNGPFSIQQNPSTVTFPAPFLQDTSYIVSLSATNQCGTTTFLDTIEVLPTPIASFGNSVSTGCSPLSVNFLNTSIGSPTNFIWSFGDGTFSTQQSPSHVFTYGPNDTTFNVMMIAINGCGSDTAYVPIEVFPNTVTSFFNTNPTVGCSPLNVQFTNFSLGANTYYWNFGDGQVSNVQSPSHIYTGSGNFTAQLVVSNGCAFDTSQINIEVLPKPNVSFNVLQDSLCTNQNYSFVNTSQQLSNTVWTFGDGQGSSLYSPTHDYLAAGTYTVSLIGTSATNGCIDTATQSIDVIQGPNLNYDDYVFEGCVPYTVQFNELSNSATSATWNYGDGTFGIGPSSNHVFGQPGTFNPTVVAQNTFGCADTASFTVVVHPNPTAAFQLSDVAVCDLPVTISTNNFSQGAISYNWNFGNGLTSTLNAPIITYVQSGNYTVSLIASNQFGCTDTSYENVEIFPRPVADFLPDVTSGCEDFTVNFTNTSSGATEFIWSFGDGTFVQAPSPGHTYYDPGVYSVSLIASNEFGCSDTLVMDNLINVYLQPTAGFSISPAEIFIDDPLIEIINTANNYQTGEYIFGNGEIYDITTSQYNYLASDSGNYLITQIVYTETGCLDTATAWIHVNLSPTLYVPNSFTANQDGENDDWIPVVTGFKTIEVRVFNRWGEEVFMTDDLSIKWNGTYQGKDCPFGTYSWRIDARDVNDELVIKWGHVTLVR